MNDSAPIFKHDEISDQLLLCFYLFLILFASSQSDLWIYLKSLKYIGHFLSVSPLFVSCHVQKFPAGWWGPHVECNLCGTTNQLYSSSSDWRGRSCNVQDRFYDNFTDNRMSKSRQAPAATLHVVFQVSDWSSEKL